MRLCVRLGLVLLTTACSYWGRRPLDELKPIDPDAPVWIWTHAGVEKWHRVQITRDSVLGVPATSQITADHLCKMCGRSIPRTQVDSMQVGYTTWVERLTEIVVGIPILLVACCYGH